MTREVVGLSGPRGSGKTTIAQRLVSEFGFGVASFGEFVRREARRLGQSTDIPSLEALGRSLIATWGWKRFCSAVLAQATPSDFLVIDGLRHVGAVDTLRETTAPARFSLVYVDIDDEVRLQRLAGRASRSSSSTPAEYDGMKDELLMLRERATLLVDGTCDDTTARIATLVGAR